MTPEPTTTPPLDRRTITAAIAILALSAFVMILNETVLGVALPQLMADFNVSATTVQWLTTGFLLTMAIVIPMTGFLLQRYSIRRLFITAISLFLFGTIVASVAPVFSIVLTGRVLQAAGTAIIMPLLMTTTLTLVPPQFRGSVMGLNSVVISVGPAIGPTLSGLVIDAFNWRWVFGLMIPVAVIAMVVGALLMPRIGGGGSASLDIPSVILSLLGFGGVVTAISTIADLSAGSPVPVVAGPIGLIALVSFVIRQRRLLVQGPGRALLDLTPFRERRFALSVVVVMVAMGTMLGTVLVLPMFAQTAMGLTVLGTGLMLLPGGVLQGLLSPFVGRLYDMFGALPLVIPGTIVLAGAEWWMSTMTANTTVPQLIGMHLVFATGMAFVLTPMLTHALSSLPVRLYGHGSAIVNALQQLGGAIGIAAMIGGMALGAEMSRGGGSAADTAGIHLAFVVGGSLALIAVCCAPFLGRKQTVFPSQRG
ncbi:DHA2 family efflux MFS transporter permease subunit [Leucobacter sp. 1207-22]|uniref:DHA2 family efflux MFS transporter permease subunit n=1 Tax=Leucobacter sp. 1207-22 TaxID=2604456 RepID=UPI00406303C8